MEERINTGVHSVTVSGRKAGVITGVKDVISFDLHSILLETECGMLHIKGNNLHINRLLVEKGELSIDGTIDNIGYTAVSTPAQKGESVLARLFK
jgi:sporulation protein YabP